MTNNTQSKSELKPTNIPWLGDIPADWEVRKITRIFDLISSGTTPNTSKKEYYENGTIKWVNTGDLTDGYLDDCEKMITPLAVQENTTLKVYPKNSLIIALYGATIGKLGILNFEATVNQACCVMSKTNIADVKFIYYWFLSNKDNIVRMSYGGGQPNISQDIVKSLKIPLPPLPTQKDIVEYLDTKTNLISQFISDKQTMITRLKEQKQSLIHNAVTKGISKNSELKPTNIPWLGDIPADWEVTSLKWISKIFSGGTPSKDIQKYWENGTVPWLASGEVNQGMIKFPTNYITEEALKNSSAKWIEKDSLVLALAGQGKTRGMVGYLTFKSTCNQSLGVIVPNKKLANSNYLYFYLKSIYQQIRGLTGEDIRDGLNLQLLGNLQIPLPPLEAQQAIVEYLDIETAKIDSLIETITQEIELTREYKQSLIYKAVTGKISVQ